MMLYSILSINFGDGGVECHCHKIKGDLFVCGSNDWTKGLVYFRKVP